MLKDFRGAKKDFRGAAVSNIHVKVEIKPRVQIKAAFYGMTIIRIDRNRQRGPSPARSEARYKLPPTGVACSRVQSAHVLQPPASGRRRCRYCCCCG